jgi:hypothetical protein
MSSFYQDASLVMIPSGYKTGKVYSAVPTDGTGDLVFTRSNDTATRVGPNGLIEKVRTNQVRNSTMVGASAPSTLPTNWVLQSAGLTFTVIGTGTEDGYTYLEVNATGTASSSNARIGFDSSTQILGATGQYWTNSFYFKKVSETAAPDSYAMAIFENTAAGSLVLANVGSLPATTSLARYSYTVLTSGGATVARVQPFVRFNLTLGNSYNFTFRISATQMETGDIATDYIPTTTTAVSVGPVANVPRLDYLNSTCPKLLLEPQRTNLALYSEQFNNAAWVATSTTVTANTTISPDGYQNADTMIIADSNSRIVQVSSLGAGTYTISAYVKVLSTTTAGTMRFAPVVDGSNANSFFTPTTEWARYTQTFTAATGVTAIALRGSATGFVGNVAVYGFQIEVGSYATSYIPTLAASVTRGDDAASKTGISSLIGQTQGTLFAELTANRTGIAQNFEIGDGTANNRVDVRLTALNLFQLVIVQGGVVVYNQTSTTTFAQGQSIKIAAAYKSGVVTELFVNGVSVASATAGAISGSLNSLYFLTNAGGGLDAINSPVSQLLIFKTRLSNNALASLTTL